MGSSSDKKTQPIKYFNDFDYNNNNVDKVKLEFSLHKCSPDMLYVINAFILGKEEMSFKSEELKASNNNILFDKFFICDFYPQMNQEIQVIIYKKNNPIKTIKINHIFTLKLIR